MGNRGKISGSYKPNAWTSSSSYSEYVKEATLLGFPVRSKFEHTDICRSIFKEIGNSIVYNNMEWGFNYGTLAIRKYKPDFKAIDWKVGEYSITKTGVFVAGKTIVTPTAPLSINSGYLYDVFIDGANTIIIRTSDLGTYGATGTNDTLGSLVPEGLEIRIYQ